MCIRDRVRRVTWLRLRSQNRHLPAIKLRTARVGEQPVEAPRDVAQMKTGGCRSAWAMPQLLDGKRQGRGDDLLAAQEEAMRRRHEQRRDAWQRSPQPDLGEFFGTHGVTVRGAPTGAPRTPNLLLRLLG